MKKIFQTPTIDVINFTVEDVLTNSGEIVNDGFTPENDGVFY